MPTKKKILLADDTNTILEFLGIQLKASGYDVLLLPADREYYD
jgi:DNA-binding response OmpR family regulator